MVVDAASPPFTITLVLRFLLLLRQLLASRQYVSSLRFAGPPAVGKDNFLSFLLCVEEDALYHDRFSTLRSSYEALPSQEESFALTWQRVNRERSYLATTMFV